MNGRTWKRGVAWCVPQSGLSAPTLIVHIPVCVWPFSMEMAALMCWLQTMVVSCSDQSDMNRHNTLQDVGQIWSDAAAETNDRATETGSRRLFHYKLKYIERFFFKWLLISVQHGWMYFPLFIKSNQIESTINWWVTAPSNLSIFYLIFNLLKLMIHLFLLKQQQLFYINWQ